MTTCAHAIQVHKQRYCRLSFKQITAPTCTPERMKQCAALHLWQQIESFKIRRTAAIK